MALPPGTYTFQISYKGASQQKSQNIGTNPSVIFQTTLVTMKLLSSTNTELNGGAQYYASGWKTFGGGATTTTMELLPLTYTFQVSYGGASQQLSQNVASNPNVVFQTRLVTMKLLSSDGSAELTGTTQYYAGGWKTFGGGTTTATMELLPLTYTFQISYKGASQQKSQNIGTNPSVIFQTTLVTMKLLSSTGQELSGGAQYNAGGWKTFGAGTTTATMELLPLTYTFKISYGGASQQKSQNVATNANVVFQTVQVHSDSGKCTSYLAGSWRTFSQDMELLPGTYTFRFSDGTANTSYTLVVGAVNHIH
jgi:cellobiose-specific phosphotransferase system component IIC